MTLIAASASALSLCLVALVVLFASQLPANLALAYFTVGLVVFFLSAYVVGAFEV
jgi:hypothetical protein